MTPEKEKMPLIVAGKYKYVAEFQCDKQFDGIIGELVMFDGDEVGLRLVSEHGYNFLFRWQGSREQFQNTWVMYEE